MHAELKEQRIESWLDHCNGRCEWHVGTARAAAAAGEGLVCSIRYYAILELCIRLDQKKTCSIRNICRKRSLCLPMKDCAEGVEAFYSPVHFKSPSNLRFTTLCRGADTDMSTTVPMFPTLFPFSLFSPSFLICSYKKKLKPAATTASTPPVTSTLSAAAAPVLEAPSALPVALPLLVAPEPEVALIALSPSFEEAVALDLDDVLLATMRVVVP